MKKEGRAGSALAGLAIAGAIVAGQVGPAKALMVIDSDTVKVEAVGESFMVGYTCQGAAPACGISPPPRTLQATTMWTVATFTSTQVVFNISVSNLTAVGVPVERITGFGVQILTPDFNNGATVANSGGGPPNAEWSIVGNIGGAVDLGLSDSQSGGVSGVYEGQTDTLALTLNFTGGSNPTTNGLTLDIFPVRFFEGTTITPTASYKFDGIVKTPEPATLTLLGGSLLGLGWAVRRRRKAA